MTLQEYYNFPEGSNVKMSYIPSFFDSVPSGYPAFPNMNYAFSYYQGNTIPNIDTSNVTDMSHMFAEGCPNITTLDLRAWDTSNVTKMTMMFYKYGILAEVNLSGWDTSNVTDMSYMFNTCSGLASMDLSGWDTSNVTNMVSMFNGCKSLTSLDLSDWDFSNVTDMSSMFNTCSGLTSINLSGWDTSNVTKMYGMFSGCKSLTSLDLSNLNTSKVTDMDSMFKDCTGLTSISSINADSLTVSTYSSPFGTSDNKTLVDFGGFINLKNSWNGSYAVNKLTVLSHQSLLNILNGLYDFTGKGETPTSSQGKLKLGSNHLNSLSDEEKTIATSKGWQLSA